MFGKLNPRDNTEKSTEHREQVSQENFLGHVSSRGVKAIHSGSGVAIIVFCAASAPEAVAAGHGNAQVRLSAECHLVCRSSHSLRWIISRGAGSAPSGSGGRLQRNSRLFPSGS